MPSASMHHPMASRLVASGDEQQQLQLQQQQHEEGNATSFQAGPGIPIDPSRITRLSWQPRAFLYSGFLSHDECDHLITLVSLSFPPRSFSALLSVHSSMILKTLMLSFPFSALAFSSLVSLIFSHVSAVPALRRTLLAFPPCFPHSPT
ncbi:unnamed protein product, partial [Closterium sp. NIES-54]